MVNSCQVDDRRYIPKNNFLTIDLSEDEELDYR